MSENEKQTKIISSGVLGGRLFGVLVNMIVLEYILELYDNIYLASFLLVISVIILLLLRKKVCCFFTENKWNKSYCIIYLAVTVMFCSLISIAGYYDEDLKIVVVSHVPIQAKIILLVAGVVATLLSVIPDSAFMKMASENEKRLV